MSAKKWKPSESRIKQLYVVEEKSIKQLREIINKEFGLIATERQYKAKIQQMKLERNVKTKERRTILQHIQHRKYSVGKESRHVRIRGHKITAEKLARWMKESIINHPVLLTSPLSPITSEISIVTNSSPGSPTMIPSAFSEYQAPAIEPTIQSDMKTAVIRRLFAHVHKLALEAQEARSIFKDFQLILDCKPMKIHFRKWASGWSYQENAIRKKIVARVQDLMNLPRRIIVDTEVNNPHETTLGLSSRSLGVIPSRGRHRCISWMTPYGSVQLSLWATSDRSPPNVGDEETINFADEAFTVRMAMVPSRKVAASSLIMFDFTPHLNLPAKITYRAMIPNHSEVFRIVKRGQVKELIQALEEGTARLTDRDEDGRSLLNYAVHSSEIDMCKYLLDKGADPNAIEIDEYGWSGPLHSMCRMLDSDMNEVATLEHILNIEGLFIGPKNTCKPTYWVDSEEEPLFQLARLCGYYFVAAFHIVDKAILLLKRKTNILGRLSNGDNVLHTLLKCQRYHEIEPRKPRGAVLFYEDRVMRLRENSFYLSVTEPLQLLLAFITAGADIYTINNRGQTPTMVARKYGREHEWAEALALCGIDPEEVFAQSDLAVYNDTHIQTSRLSFDQFCQNRQEHLRFKEKYFGEYCQSCGEKFRPEIVSLDERCPECGKRFQPKEVPLEGHYRWWLENYLHEKARWTKYYQEWLGSCLSDEEITDEDAAITDEDAEITDEDAEITDEDEEIADQDEVITDQEVIADQDEVIDEGEATNIDGQSRIIRAAYKSHESMEISQEPADLDAEDMLWSEWSREQPEAGEFDDRGVCVDLQETTVHERELRDGFTKDANDQVMGGGIDRGNALDESNRNTGNPIADGMNTLDMNMFDDFFDFSSL
ncbi:hypothetical protein EPUS_02818 [Endocarpon pusillum Z07020]|uniref:Clr5 domain-containing protein n=1 Tax=Endocarpon pusillum (strain Z07020 / HMAS-L-300199) TaxID=1263415 RepID=U1G5C5_ENDPU|nr:uncharacterized protein EPUS_02818 [Endocarpon pusillum Z07020]ERF72537.1 hypothetical protein EPUS_02818 [Endocarpon pusillum Z07020]